jgi:hypothetical protein
MVGTKIRGREFENERRGRPFQDEFIMEGKAGTWATQSLGEFRNLKSEVPSACAMLSWK